MVKQVFIDLEKFKCYTLFFKLPVKFKKKNEFCAVNRSMQK